MHKHIKGKKIKKSAQAVALGHKASSPPAQFPLPESVKKKRRKRTHKLVLRHLTLDDFDYLKAIMDRVYADMGGSWTRK